MNKAEFANLAILSCRHFRGKLHVNEYLDLKTGEIIEAAPIIRMGMKAIRPDAMRRREDKLDSLRKEIREFVLFLLKFRNRFGGFLMSLDQLIKWYGKLEGKAAKHIRRYLPRLVDAGILDFDHRLNPDFMRFDPEVGRDGVRGETFTAYRIFDELRLRALRDEGVRERHGEAERMAA